MVIRYQLSDHLGSASVELDENADIISYEEYYPFGSTSYRSGRTETEVKQKRYKYVLKELDNETGLYYYGARYYASWLGRFIAIDPKQHNYQNLNPYNYVANNPLNNTDPDGMDIDPTNDESGKKAKEAIDRILKYDEVSNLFSYNEETGKMETAGKKEFIETFLVNKDRLKKISFNNQRDLIALTYGFYLAVNLEEKLVINIENSGMPGIKKTETKGEFYTELPIDGSLNNAQVISYLSEGQKERKRGFASKMQYIEIPTADGKSTTFIEEQVYFSEYRNNPKYSIEDIKFLDTFDETFVHEIIGEFVGMVKTKGTDYSEKTIKEPNDYHYLGLDVIPVQTQNIYRRFHNVNGFRTGVRHGARYPYGGFQNPHDLPYFLKNFIEKVLM